MSKKIIALSSYKKERPTHRVSVSNFQSKLIDFDQYRRRKAEEAQQYCEYKGSPQKTDLSDYRRRIVNGDYVVNPQAIAESILRRLVSRESQTNELPLVNPDRSS